MYISNFFNFMSLHITKAVKMCGVVWNLLLEIKEIKILKNQKWKLKLKWEGDSPFDYFLNRACFLYKIGSKIRQLTKIHHLNIWIHFPLLNTPSLNICSDQARLCFSNHFIGAHLNSWVLETLFLIKVFLIKVSSTHF